MERDLIADIARRSQDALRDRTVLLGIGDDCAVIRPEGGSSLVFTTDALVEGIHFDLAYFPPRLLGRKTAAVNLSDVAAMGARPRWALLNLGARPGLPAGFWDRFAEGLIARLAEFGVTLIGGDTVASPQALFVALTLVGEVADGEALRRDAARPGDLIFCSGPLGEAAAGLEWLKAVSEGRRITPALPRAIRRRLSLRHLDPEPRVALGRALAQGGGVRAAIDLSDGLATDLAHVCARSGVAAEIPADQVPLSRALRSAARLFGKEPLNWALSGGEDFELLWTVAPGEARAVTARVAGLTGRAPHRLGRIVEGSGVWLLGPSGRRGIAYEGYEHRT